MPALATLFFLFVIVPCLLALFNYIFYAGESEKYIHKICTRILSIILFFAGFFTGWFFILFWFFACFAWTAGDTTELDKERYQKKLAKNKPIDNKQTYKNYQKLYKSWHG